MGSAGTATEHAARAAELPRSPFRQLVLPVTFVVANVFLLFGYRVPHSNEYVYLLRLRAVHDPSFLAHDWTFTRSFSEHFLFNSIFSPLTGLLSTEALGWVGRVVCWTALSVLLLELARNLGVRRWPAALALAVWLPCQLRLVGADWVFGGFEAKPISYIVLFSALLLAFRRRTPWALAAAGLAFSFHPGVGIWASVPLVLALAWWNPTRADTLRWWWIAALAASPGAVSTLSGLGATAAPAEVWEFVVEQAHPFHLDPFYFGVRNVLLLAVMFGFNLAWGRIRPRPRAIDGLLGPLQIFMAAPVIAGIVIYLAGRDELLKYYPFRVFPVLISLLFFFNLTDAWAQRRSLFSSPGRSRSIGILAIVVAVTTLVVWNPPKLYVSSVRLVYRDWTSTTDTDRDDALRWIAANVPADAVVVLPPGPEDTFYLAERAQIVNQKSLSFDEIDEWYERLNRIAPGATDLDLVGAEDEEDLEPLYESLSEADVLALHDDYGATYMVTAADYDFTVLHRDGGWRVYKLPPG